MNTYQVYGAGRSKGAIGIFYPRIFQVEAESPDAAILASYETTDWYLTPRCSPVKLTKPQQRALKVLADLGHQFYQPDYPQAYEALHVLRFATIGYSAGKPCYRITDRGRAAYSLQRK